jgi:signal peptidase I
MGLVPVVADRPFASVGLSFVQIMLFLAILRLLLRTTLGRTTLVAVIWGAMSVGYTVAFYFLVRLALFEAFVIPSGGMAETLWGYHTVVRCPQCDYEFPVNCSQEVEQRPPVTVVGCTCPNCRFEIDFDREHLTPRRAGGDRVLVAKSVLSRVPERLDVVVFRYPAEPEIKGTSINYIKRIIGLPGETIAIYGGKLYVLNGERAPKYDDSASPPQDRWQRQFMHPDEANALLKQPDSHFEIVRKPPAKILTMRRLVYNDDRRPRDLRESGASRWTHWADAAGSWRADESHRFYHTDSSGDHLDWLLYRHILREGNEPELITDFMGYNTRARQGNWGRAGVEHPLLAPNWVGDLILECAVKVDQPAGELVLELTKGVEHFQARWQLASGVCTLVRATSERETELASKPTSVKKQGTYCLRFANVDERLTVWVDDQLPFAEGVAYRGPAERGPQRNDLQPARIGSRGAAVGVDHIQLWRDTYYTVTAVPSSADAVSVQEILLAANDLPVARQDLHRLLNNPDRWDDLRNLHGTTMYVQPDHYLVLGDNSPESADSRTWGLVPGSHLMGQAVAIYWPFARTKQVE